MSLVVRTLPDQIYQALRHRILLGQIGPGMPMRQDMIANELGISKIPLREALTRLEQDGLVNSYPNRGYVVRPLSAEEAGEVYALRLKLEPEAAAAACRKADADDHRAATDALTALETEMDLRDGDPMTCNRAFHMALVRPMRGPVTIQLIERLHVLAERYVRVHLTPGGRQTRARSEHRALLESWLAADSAEVERLTTAHIRSTLADLRVELGA